MIHILDNINKKTYSDWINKLYLSARVCYSDKSINELKKECSNFSLEHKEEFLEKNILNTGHWSVLEHISFTFVFEDVSRSLTHQLVRHRHLSYSQKSQRYTKLTKDNFLIIPEKLKDNNNVKMLTEELQSCIINIKNQLKEFGFHDEDIRYIYPNGMKTTIVISGNLRAILEVMKKRLCLRAQDEIRIIFNELKKQLEDKLPKNNIITKFMIPNCQNCKEIHKCKRN